MKPKSVFFLWLICLATFSQVPDNETFSFLNVTGQINGGGAVARVDLVHKSGNTSDCTVSCNGVSRTMEWNTNPSVTVQDFIEAYGDDFGAVTLDYYAYGEFTFTANVPGTDFTAAAITGTGNYAENLVPNYSGTSVNDFLSCFSYANIAKFDKNYYPRYSINGPHFNVSNSLLNWRNYGAVLRPPMYLICREQSVSSLYWYWSDNSWDEDGFYVERSLDGKTGWIEVETTGPNVQGFHDTGLTPDTWYYYRVRAFNESGNSEWVTGWAQTYSFDDTDWHLPSWEELAKMYVNLKTYGVGGFSDQIYWSSTETAVGMSYATSISFATGIPINIDKANTASVRAARSFTGTYGQYSLRSTGPSKGLIFHIEQQYDGTYRYYEAHPQDQSVSQAWSNITNTRVGGTYSVIAAGLNNTLRIINQAGHTNSAAKVCNDLN